MIGLKSRVRTVLCASLCLTASVACLLQTPVMAQTAADSKQAEPTAEASTVCLSGQQKMGEGKGRPVGIMVPAEKVEKFLKRGFVQSGCGKIRKQSEAERRQMCELAATGNRAVALAYWQRFSVTPLEMCRGVSADLGN